MDIGVIDRVANRKRFFEDLKTVGEKVTKENAKLIKLQVAQDTAYWELKEKLSAAKGDHERLQQNMFELQMQYETLSGQYQDELRLRSETLNKVSTNRKIFDELQEHAERLRQSLLRTKTDQAALYDAYMCSDKVVRDLKQNYTQVQERSRQLSQELDTVKVTNDHLNQMIQVYAAAKQQTECEMSELRNKLDVTLKFKEDTISEINDLNRKLDLSKFELEKRDDIISDAQREMKQTINDFNKQMAEARNILMQKENDLKSAAEEIDSFKQALSNQEEFTKSVCDQNSELQEKLAVVQDDYQKLVAVNNSLEVKLQDITTVCENLSSNIAALTQANEDLTKAVNDKEKICADTEFQYASYREASEDKQKMLETRIEKMNKELESNVSTLEQLNSELQKVKSEKEIVEENAEAKEKKLNARLALLETTIRDKDEELAQQMSKFLEMRNESEREKSSLLEKISDMEKRIQNIMKEASAPRGELRFQPEPDENAVMLTPQHKIAEPQPQPQPPLPQLCDFMFDFFSDQSAASLDSQEVNRRFDALSRGSPLPPAPLAALTRRHRKPQRQPHESHPTKRTNVSTVPQTEEKNKTRRFFKTRK